MIPFLTELSKWEIFEPDASSQISKEMACFSEPLRLALMSRGILTGADIKKFTCGTIKDLYSPFLLKGMDEACRLFIENEKSKGKVRIFGDYDVDGLTSSASLIKFCSENGIDCDCFIPNRLEEGYGVSQKGTDTAKEDGIALAITADCGISADKQIKTLKEAGIRTIILDHHTLPAVLPEADAIVNPMNPECGYPCKYLSGVGIVLKFIQAICEKKGLPFPEKYLIPAAIGLIGDIMPLKDETRIIVREGLSRISSCKEQWPFIFSMAKRESEITSRTVSWSIAPLLNGAGRLGDCSPALMALLAESEEEGTEYEKKLKEFKDRRKDIEEKMREGIIFSPKTDLLRHRVMIEYGEKLHAGMLGITAAKLVDQYSMPVFLIALKDGIGRGSARSGEGYNIHSMLSDNKDLLLTYGGHVQAGGFSIKEENIPAFIERICMREPDMPPEKYKCDGTLQLGRLSEYAINELSLLNPSGKDNEEPVFMFKNISIVSKIRRKQSISLLLSDGKTRIDAIAFGQAAHIDHIKEDIARYDIAAEPYINDHSGFRKPSLKIKSIIYPDNNAILSAEGKLPENKDGRPLIINASYIKDKIAYASRIAELSKAAAIAADNSRKTYLEKKFGKSSGIAPSLLNAKSLPEDEKFDDIFITGPLFSDAVLYSQIIKNSKRIHFLYEKEDIERERRFLDECRPDARKINETLSIIRSGNFSEGPSLALEISKSSHGMITRGAAVYAVKILFEMGKISRRGDGKLNAAKGSASQSEIESSKSFMTYSETERKFESEQSLYLKSFEKFASGISERIAGGSEALKA